MRKSTLINRPTTQQQKEKEKEKEENKNLG